MAGKKSRPAASEMQKRPDTVNVAGKPLKEGDGKYTHLLIMAGIALICWFFLRGCLNNQFTDWDDPAYIRDNALVKSLSQANLKAIFSTPVMANYHPLTILTLAIEYGIAGLEPGLYYADNLLLHIINTLLVYWLVYLLTKRPVAGAVTALLFGLHPMHVESVAWISARKDLLYGLFFIGACITYVYSLRSPAKKKIWYAVTVALFICSLLSKALAVTLPIVLLLIDYYEGKKWEPAIAINKLPFFITALVFGIVAFKAQSTAGAMAMQTTHYNFAERIALGGYSFVTYVYKAVVPVHLSNIYAYPDKVNNALPFMYYLYPLIAVVLIALLYRYGRKNKTVVFGVVFFITNIALLLQLIQVGSVIVAERYTYIAYIGLFFIAGWYFSELVARSHGKQYFKIATAGAVIYMLTLFFAAGARCEVWHDATTLWLDAIQKDPVHAIGGYNNLGYMYFQEFSRATDPQEKKKDFDSAFYFLNTAITLRPEYVNPYISLGEMERSAGMYNEARMNYIKALSYHPKDPNMHLGLAILYYVRKDMDSAALWFRQAIIVEPSAQAYCNYASFLDGIGKKDSALFYFDTAVLKSPGEYVNYMNRGKLYLNVHKIDEALADFDKAVQLDPDIPALYYQRSLCYSARGDRDRARADAEKAASMGFNVDGAYLQSLR